MLIRTYADIEKLEGDDALSEAERTLIENCKRGEFTTLGDGARPIGPSKERAIRAELLRYLILGGCDRCEVHELGVELIGAWIEGELDLSFAQARGAVRLVQCGFEEALLARQACFQILMLESSMLPGLYADGAKILYQVLLDGLTSRGEISFAGAEIGGQLACENAELNGGDGKALNAPGATIRGGAFLRRLKSYGEVSFVSAEIGVGLVGDGAELNGGDGIALNANAAMIEGGVSFDNAKSRGEVSFVGADIGGQFSSARAELNGGEGKALNAQSVKIKGGAFLLEMKSDGEVSFSGAEVGGQFSCKDAILSCRIGMALNAQNTTIRRDAILSRMKSHGEVSFGGAEIGGQFSIQDAELHGVQGMALNAQGATINDSTFLHRLKSVGEVSFAGAAIAGQLSFHRAELNGGNQKALNCQHMIVKEGLFWREVKSIAGTIDLNSARLGDLVDDESSWNIVTDLILVGVTYENLIGPLNLNFRKTWLRRGAEPEDQFHPQPYQQLAKFYRETGHRYEAREILVAKEIEQRKATRKAIREGKARTESWLHPSVLALRELLWDWTTRLIAGYGYKPWLSLWWLGCLVALMMLAAQATWNAGDFAPNSAVVLTSQDWKTIADGPSQNPAADWTDTLAPGKDYETFYSFAYALDVVVPVLDLGQTDAWAPSPARGDRGYWMFYLQKIFIVLGWVVTAIAAAAISGMIRRDD